MHPTLRRTASAFAAAGAIAGTTVLVAPAAEAAKPVCANSSGKASNCLHVIGDTRVDGVKIGRFSRDPADDDNVCIGWVKWYAVDPNGAHDGGGGYHVAGCGIGGEYFTLNVDRWFADGTEICAMVYPYEPHEEGEHVDMYPGQPCTTLHGPDEAAPGAGPPSNGTPT